METIGQIIKTRRSERGLTLAEAHEATKITMQNLAAIEEDRFDAFPNRVYARAFLRDYANYLALDSGDLLQRYEQEWGTPVPVPMRRRPGAKPLTIVFSALVIVAILAGAATYYINYVPRPARVVKPMETASVQPAPKPIPAPLKPKPVPAIAKPAVPKPQPIKPAAPIALANGATPKPAVPKPAIPKPVTHVPAPAPNKVTVVMKATTSPVWVSARVDGRSAIQQTLKPGQTATLVGDFKIFVIAGNAGGLDVTYNGKHIGTLGARGQVARRAFTR